MSDDYNNEGTEQNHDEIVEFIVQRLRSGATKTSISQELSLKGLNIDEATELIEEISAEVEAIAEDEALTPPMLVTAALGAVVASIIGGLIWGLVGVYTDTEHGYVALGLGFISGYVVVFFAKGKKGIALQMISSLSSILGIFLGKYYYYQQVLQEYYLEEYGAEAAADATLFNPKVMSLFMQDLPQMLGGYDLLWVVLAVYIAWQIPAGSGFKQA